jgi:hypothetical protein
MIKQTSYTLQCQAVEVDAAQGISQLVFEWTAPRKHSPADFIVIGYADHPNEILYTQRLDDGGAKGKVVVTDEDVLKKIRSAWPVYQPHQNARLVTPSPTGRRADEQVVATCPIVFKGLEEELRRKAKAKEEYEKNMWKTVKSTISNGLKMDFALQTDPNEVRADSFNAMVHCIGTFSNISEKPILLNFRDVHGFCSGRLHIRRLPAEEQEGDVDEKPKRAVPGPPGPSRPPGPPRHPGPPRPPGPPRHPRHPAPPSSDCPVIYSLPPAPQTFQGGSRGLVLLQPNESWTQRFYLVAPFARPPPPGKYVLTLCQTQPAYQEEFVSENKEYLWKGKISVEHEIELN